MGADVETVRVGMGSDNRIGKRFLFPGVGYGGSCFPKDVKALNQMAGASGYNFSVLKSVMEVNDKQRVILVDKIISQFGNDLSGKTFAMWGNNQYEVLKDADALIIVTEWSVFRTPDFDIMKQSMKNNMIFDGRNLFELDELKAQGFYYESIGRAKVQG